MKNTHENAAGHLFTSVQSHNALEQTVERITGAIKVRLLGPGDQLPPERELAQQLGVSRSTLREALSALVKAGFLEVRRGRTGGTFVVRWPDIPAMPRREVIVARMRDQIPTQLDFRRAVEPAAAELAAARATPAAVTELEAILASMVGSERDFDRYRATDVRFHVGIARAANSPMILQAVTDIQTALTDVLDLIVYHVKRVLLHSSEYHTRILEAIRRGDEAQAHQLMLDHILATENIIHGLIPETGR